MIPSIYTAFLVLPPYWQAAAAVTTVGAAVAASRCGASMRARGLAFMHGQGRVVCAPSSLLTPDLPA
jgi:hypothetical protein